MLKKDVYDLTAIVERCTIQRRHSLQASHSNKCGMSLQIAIPADSHSPADLLATNAVQLL